jgi:DNA-binding SARP family transcriptional activator
MQRSEHGAPVSPGLDTWPILIRLLGEFQLLKRGQPVAIRAGSKTQGLLRALALHPGYVLPRGDLTDLLWPQSPSTLAGQSLHSLVHSLRRLVGDGIGGAAPVIRTGEGYRLNVEAGVGVDVALFDHLAESGVREARTGDRQSAVELFRRAITLYRGDLCGGTDVYSVVERERLRAAHLTLLAHLADYHFSRGDLTSCLHDALRLLAHEPCREDAHRLVMQCYVRNGQRAQALRQYRLCEQILRAEFDAIPELATRTLFEQIRIDPGSV